MCMFTFLRMYQLWISVVYICLFHTHEIVFVLAGDLCIASLCHCVHTACKP